MAEKGSLTPIPRDYGREELDNLCWPIFCKLLEELGERYHNWIVVVEPESGEYFLGLDDCEVLSRARKRYPRAQFFAYRLSENPAVDHLG
jgi:hypothetical protein